MKIECEILSVATNGDQLSVRAQGDAKASAAWRAKEVVTFTVPDSMANCEAYRVGRLVTVEIKPKASRR